MNRFRRGILLLKIFVSSKHYSKRLGLAYVAPIERKEVAVHVVTVIIRAMRIKELRKQKQLETIKTLLGLTERLLALKKKHTRNVAPNN